MQAPKKPGSFVKNFWQGIVSLATNKFFSLGLLGILILIAAGYLLVDRIMMPSYVRHNVSVTVPNLTDLQVDDARVQLEALDLQAEVEPGRYNPDLPRNVVVDQNPQPNIYVKPGRRVYLTINTGATPEVTVPSLEGISLNQAKHILFAAGLKAEGRDIRPDSIPYNPKGVVTRQYPSSGSVVKEGSRIRVWYSTGLGDRYVTVPSVVGMTGQEASRQLLSLKIRSIILGAPDHPDPSSLEVRAQGHGEGTRVREGTEVRLFVRPPANDEN